jgi:hypothetical protein
LRKVIGFLFSGFFIINACSLLKKAGNKDFLKQELTSNYNKSEIIKNGNLTNGNFFISRAEIQLIKDRKIERIIGTIKHTIDGRYLVTLKSREGIEGARIFISTDTILINDRLNRNLYYGSKSDFKIQFGITIELISLIFGDYISDHLTDTIIEKCTSGTTEAVMHKDGLNIMYLFDCNRSKIISTTLNNGMDSEKIHLRFKEFKMIERTVYPRIIEIDGMQRLGKLTIKITEIELINDGKINFIPGKNFKMIPLI